MVSQSLYQLIFLFAATTISAKPLHQLVGLNSFVKGKYDFNTVVQDSLLGSVGLVSTASSTISNTLAVGSNTPSKRRAHKLASRTTSGLMSGLLTPTPVVHVDLEICLDVSLNVLGIPVLNVQALAELTADINKNGLSLQQLAIVQASVASELQASASVATSALACSAACHSDICQSSAYDKSKRTCILTPKQLQPTSSVLANLIGKLALQGSSSPDYCSLCPSKCASTPSARSRRVKRAQLPMGLCPAGLNACPISPFSASKGYECIDTQEEIESCGGCSSTGEGLNCNTIPGVKYAGCAVGQCLAFECETGFNLTSEKTCVPATL
ncbi:hypothetical protein CROQUDRAFT_71416 [Cronartium quercuum f. sp. fusiforme G11]|uniref:Protein CPL1-like domain-containing protein n=1 Tax=Cronartium quercuum f. sp. fusiforme G11 TaxID=708437 RepID=A0A9P6NWX2_9BASI|nr:hypothetical protein CROQUDRAFT_71416 [Cronartium quercuum f. sp. fusiforme G11]